MNLGRGYESHARLLEYSAPYLGIANLTRQSSQLPSLKVGSEGVSIRRSSRIHNTLEAEASEHQDSEEFYANPVQRIGDGDDQWSQLPVPAAYLRLGTAADYDGTIHQSSITNLAYLCWIGVHCCSLLELFGRSFSSGRLQPHGYGTNLPRLREENAEMEQWLP